MCVCELKFILSTNICQFLKGGGNENGAPDLTELTVRWGRQSLTNHTLRADFVSVMSAMEEKLGFDLVGEVREVFYEEVPVE